MRPIQLKDHIIPMYLSLMLLVLAPLSVVSFLLIIIPLVVISMGIHFHEQNLGLVGLLFFYVFGISQLQVASLDQILQLLLYSILILIPSLMLTAQILGVNGKKIKGHAVFHQKKQLGIIAVLVSCFVLFLFVLLQYIGLGLLFDIRSVQEQILLMASISLLLFLPMLLKNTESEESKQT